MKTAPNQNKKTNPTRNRNVNNKAPQSASKIKKRIRDVKRTLNNQGKLSAEVIISAKRSLRALEFELGEKIIDEQERSNALKYRAVKHFERKKTERRIKKAKKDLHNADKDKKTALQKELDDLEIKLLYVTHYPKTLPYVSLYPSENANDHKSVERKERVLKDIKEALKAGDKDLQLMLKKYRNEYKEKLIKRGDIKPEAPIDDAGTDDTMKENTKENDGQGDDDFFEK